LRFYSGHARKERHREMPRATDAARSVVVFARVALQQCHEFLHGLRRYARMDREEIARARDIRHRCEVAVDVVRHVDIESGIHRKRRCSHQQRVTVRRRLRHDFGADEGTGARTVVDHNLLTETLAQFLAYQACDGVRRTAGRIGHDQTDRLHWIFSTRGRPCGGGNHQDDCAGGSHFGSPTKWLVALEPH
jgi:hypothetical protein